jgi:hypothetical protein
MARKYSRKIPLVAVCVLAVIVLVRLCLVTYWSLGSADPDSAIRLSASWLGALCVLAILFRFAWQIWAGRHQTWWNRERR